LRDFMAHGEMERQSESLSRLISEASALAMIGAKEQGVELAVSLDPSADAVLVDRIQIQQVLVNLMRNAIEAMAGSQVRQLEIQSRRETHGFIRVTVADSGPGLAPEVSDKLFQPFVTTKPEGMGIGLSICQTIVEAHEGRIWAEPSRLGGTAFHFTLVNAEEAEDV
jgi:two-component system sensor kinase FixL